MDGRAHYLFVVRLSITQKTGSSKGRKGCLTFKCLNLFICETRKAQYPTHAPNKSPLPPPSQIFTRRWYSLSLNSGSMASGSYKQTNKQTNMHTDRQTDRQTDKLANECMNNCVIIMSFSIREMSPFQKHWECREVESWGTPPGPLRVEYLCV